MDATLLANLGAYSAQVVIIAALGTLVAALLRVDAAGIRYAYWRLLLAACVLLPFVQRWWDPAELVPAAAAGAAAVEVELDVAVTEMAAAGSPAASVDWFWVAGAVILGGMALRAVWLAASLMSLRRMRALGQLATASELHDELQRLLDTRAEIRYVDGLRQPVTFGTIRPVVLLPATLREHPDEIQRAVLCHELIHVQRRDWLWVLGEEAVRAALWFNPAVWWLIARVQATREELVDELTVLATNRRRAYMEALLAFADETPLAPAAAFARRRHLFRRMVLLSKEGVMSSKRIVFSAAVMAIVMAAGSWYAVGAFPLTRALVPAQQLTTEPGPLEKQAKPVTPENPVPRRVNSATADYPADADLVGMTGTVMYRITLDELGRVAEVRKMSLTFRATNPDVRGSLVQRITPDGLDALLGRTDPVHRTALRSAVTALETAAFDAVRQWRYDPPHEAPLSFPVAIQVGTPPAPVAAPSVSGQYVIPDGAIRVGGNIKAPTKIRDVRPVYPDIAQQARVQGVVIIETVIGPDGGVQDAKVLRSIPLLDEAALEAVRQWRFTPTLLNGVPIPVVMTVTVNFTVQ
jgi:TonB family protein